MFAVEIRRRAGVAAAAVIATLIAAPQFPVTAIAQDAPAAVSEPAPDTVVATVNGKEITEAEVSLAEESFAEELANLPPAMVRGAVIDAVIDLYLVSEAAKEAKLDQDASFRQRMDFLRQRVLRAEYLGKVVAPTVTEEKLRARYDEEIAKLELGDEVRASHILVATEDEAKAIITEIEGGADFATIAKEKSTDPGSGQAGGDLGYFTKEAMVEPFANAAFALEVGGLTKAPVQSQFGWHVIKVVDRRKQEPPSFDEVKDQLANGMMREAAAAELKKLREAAKVDIVDAAAKPEAAPPAGEAKPAQ